MFSPLQQGEIKLSIDTSLHRPICFPSAATINFPFKRNYALYCNLFCAFINAGKEEINASFDDHNSEWVLALMAWINCRNN